MLEAIQRPPCDFMSLLTALGITGVAFTHTSRGTLSAARRAARAAA